MMGRVEFIGGKVSTHLIDDVMPDFLAENAAARSAAQRPFTHPGRQSPVRGP